MLESSHFFLLSSASTNVFVSIFSFALVLFIFSCYILPLLPFSIPFGISFLSSTTSFMLPFTHFLYPFWASCSFLCHSQSFIPLPLCIALSFHLFSTVVLVSSLFSYTLPLPPTSSHTCFHYALVLAIFGSSFISYHFPFLLSLSLLSSITRYRFPFIFFPYPCSLFLLPSLPFLLIHSSPFLYWFLFHSFSPVKLSFFHFFFLP